MKLGGTDGTRTRDLLRDRQEVKQGPEGVLGIPVRLLEDTMKFW